MGSNNRDVGVAGAPNRPEDERKKERCQRGPSGVRG
jgi:hypothetical protein